MGKALAVITFLFLTLATYAEEVAVTRLDMTGGQWVRETWWTVTWDAAGLDDDGAWNGSAGIVIPGGIRRARCTFYLEARAPVPVEGEWSATVTVDGSGAQGMPRASGELASDREPGIAPRLSERQILTGQGAWIAVGGGEEVALELRRSGPPHGPLLIDSGSWLQCEWESVISRDGFERGFNG
jgi:hypothetical protein